MRRISHFKLGFFILACAGCGAVALIWAGAARIFEKSKTYAAFFDEPVTGLSSGARVQHLGVDIGRVDSVELAPGDRVVQVVVNLRSDFQVDPSMALSVDQPGITGAPMLALEETPAPQRHEVPHPPTDHPILPTRPGGGGIGAIEKKIASLDVQGVLSTIEGTAKRISAVVDRGDIDDIVRDLRATTSQLKIAVAGISKQVDALPPGTAARVADKIERTTDLGEATLRDFDEHVGASLSLLRQDLAQLKQAALDAQSLASSLRAQPGRIVQRPANTDPFRR